MKLSFDNKVVFNPDNHTYFLTKTPLMSVTKLLSTIKPPFKGSTRTTEVRYNMTKEQVLEMWKKKNELSKERGTRIHLLIEHMLNFKPTVSKMDSLYTLSDEELNILKYVKKQSFNKHFFKCEEIVYSSKYLIAGTIDLLVIKDNKFTIHDWKTNQKELTTNYGDKFYITNDPVTSLQEYTYQLSIYAYLVEQLLNIKCSGLYIHHFHNGCKKLKVKYEKRKIKKILNEKRNKRS